MRLVCGEFDKSERLWRENVPDVKMIALGGGAVLRRDDGQVASLRNDLVMASDGDLALEVCAATHRSHLDKSHDLI